MEPNGGNHNAAKQKEQGQQPITKFRGQRYRLKKLPLLRVKANKLD